MIRLLGAVLIAFAAAWLGLRAAAELSGRVRRLDALTEGLALLRQELWARGDPLPQAFSQLSQRTEEPARTLFARCAQACGQLDQEPFSQAWSRLVRQLEGVPASGLAALLPLGEVLGRYDAEGQREAVARACSALDQVRSRAEEERLRMGRVYQALGLTGGGFLIILLL